jgi:hypothetical protein
MSRKWSRAGLSRDRLQTLGSLDDCLHVRIFQQLVDGRNLRLLVFLDTVPEAEHGVGHRKRLVLFQKALKILRRQELSFAVGSQ